MPSTSKKQHNFMAAIAHNPAFAKKVGIPQSVGKDFDEADKGKKFGSGSRAAVQAVNKSKTDHGGSAFFKKGGNTMATKGVNPFAKFEKSGKDTEKKSMKEGSKAEMAMDKKQMMGMKKGGMAEGGKADTAQDKAMIKKAFKQHDMQEHKGGKGTELKLKKGGDAKYMSFGSKGQPAGMKPVQKMASGGSFRSAANGVATKGKTKGEMVKMKMGGKAC